MVPAQLYFDQRFETEVGHNAVLEWWIENTGDVAFAKVEVTLHEPAHSGSLVFGAFSRDMEIAQGESQPCHVNIKTADPGSYRVEVLLALTDTDGRTTNVKTKRLLRFDVPNQSSNSKAPCTIVIDGEGLVRNPPPGSVIHIKGAGLVRFEKATESEKKSLSTNQQTGQPEARVLFPLPLVEDIPGIASLDLQKFASGWHDSKRHKLESFQFIDKYEQPHEPFEAPRAAYRSPCRLEIGANASGYVTLILQGAPNGQYYVALPNTDSPRPYLQPNQRLIFPSRQLRAGPVNPNNASQEFALTFGNRGAEKALVLITNEPLVSNVKPLYSDTAAVGDFTAKATDQTAIKQILTQAWEASRKDPAAAELLFTQVTVI